MNKTGPGETIGPAIQKMAGNNVEVALVDQGYTGQATADQATKHGIDVLVVKYTEAEKEFVLLPRRWVVERSVGWTA